MQIAAFERCSVLFNDVCVFKHDITAQVWRREAYFTSQSRTAVDRTADATDSSDCNFNSRERFVLNMGLNPIHFMNMHHSLPTCSVIKKLTQMISVKMAEKQIRIST